MQAKNIEQASEDGLSEVLGIVLRQDDGEFEVLKLSNVHFI